MNLPVPQVARVVPNAPCSPAAPRQDRPADGPAPAGSRLWLWFVAAFVVQILVWTAWITIARRNPVAEVPLAGAGAPTPDGRGQKAAPSQPARPNP
jgi:hypothetical protein